MILNRQEMLGIQHHLRATGLAEGDPCDLNLEIGMIWHMILHFSFSCNFFKTDVDCHTHQGTGSHSKQKII